MSSDSSTSRLLLVAAASAAASSLLTYAVFRRHTSRAERTISNARAGDAQPLSVDGNSCVLSRADAYDPSPRKGYLSWDDYFMAVAFLSAQRSKDPNKQVGACIVDANNVICGIGYNGFPRGCPDAELPWAKKSLVGNALETKYPYVCHAEMNAILNKNGASVAGARVYVTMFPCNECAKLMIQAGIREVVFHEDKDAAAARSASPPITASFNRDQQYAASRRLLALAGVKLRQHRFQRPVLLRLTDNPAAPPAAPQQRSGTENGTLHQDAPPLDGGHGTSSSAASAVDAAVRNGGLPNGDGKASVVEASAAAAGLQSRRRRPRRHNYQTQQHGQQQGQDAQQ